jgi:hypothetical protein
MPVDDAFTVALLHMNGANGSTTFTDEAGNTFLANGNAQITTAQSVFGGACGVFDGTGDFLNVAYTPNWTLDGGSNSNQWTIDLRIRFNGDPGTAIVGMVQQREDNNGFWSLLLNNKNLQFILRVAGVNTVVVQNAWNPASATWYHVACVKEGTTGYKMFIDGVQIGTTQTDTDVIPNFSGGIQVGRHTGVTGTNSDLNGWIDELRISKGIARWTANFTPPTSEYAPPTGSNFFFVS